MNYSEAIAYQLAIVWASVGNTIPSVFWILFYVLKNKEIKSKVIQEINKVFEEANLSHPDTEYPQLSQDQLNKLLVIIFLVIIIIIIIFYYVYILLFNY